VATARVGIPFGSAAYRIPNRYPGRRPSQHAAQPEILFWILEPRADCPRCAVRIL